MRRAHPAVRAATSPPRVVPGQRARGLDRVAPTSTRGTGAGHGTRATRHATRPTRSVTTCACPTWAIRDGSRLPRGLSTMQLGTEPRPAPPPPRRQFRPTPPSAPPATAARRPRPAPAGRSSIRMRTERGCSCMKVARRWPGQDAPAITARFTSTSRKRRWTCRRPRSRWSCSTSGSRRGRGSSLSC